MAIIFDVLYRFQENKVLKTAQRMNRSSSFVTMETGTFQIRSSEKYLFGFNHLKHVVKTEVFKKEQSCVNIRYLLQQQTKLF